MPKTVQAIRQSPRRVQSEAGSDSLSPANALMDAIAGHYDDPDFVTALARGLAVILSFSSRNGRMTIAQVSRETGIPRAAVRRSLHTLSKLGFAAIDESGSFYLRPRVLTVSHAFLSTSPMSLVSQPILNRLGDQLNESCSLAILDGDEIAYLARSATSRIMSPTLNVGRRLPAYCTAIGQLLLSYLPQADIDEYLKRTRLKRFTEHTVTSPKQFLALLKTIRENGYAIASQQMESRLCTMAVPVRDTSGRVVAGLNVILGRPMAETEMKKKYLDELQAAAAELGSLLMP